MAGRKKKTPEGPAISPAILSAISSVPVTPEKVDDLLLALDNSATMRAMSQADPSQDMFTIAAILQLREREALLAQLVTELAATLPDDKRSYRALRRRISEALPTPEAEADAPVHPEPPRTLAPGTKIRILHKEAWVGIVQGPSPYEGGVMVAFENGQRYAVSLGDLTVIDVTPSPEEAQEFEAWLHLQSNVMHDRPLEEITRAWRLDTDWAQRASKPYISRA